MDTPSNAESLEVSIPRLYVLRAAYLFIVVGLAFMIWPGILSHAVDVPHMNGVVRSLLGAVSLLSVLGIRYPLRMLPVLLFELVWKLIWVLSFGLPLWSADRLGPGTQETLIDCLFGIVLVLIVVPWRYVLTRYLTVPGDRWRRRAAVDA